MAAASLALGSTHSIRACPSGGSNRKNYVSPAQLTGVPATATFTQASLGCLGIPQGSKSPSSWACVGQPRSNSPRPSCRSETKRIRPASLPRLRRR